MATLVKKGGATSKVQLFSIGKQFPGTATYGDTPGDAGVIVKLLGARNDEKLIRLYGITKFDGKKTYQCGKCGLKFTSEYFRDAHGKRRHSKRPEIKDFSEISEAQQQRILADTMKYETSPDEFHVPDPGDRETSQYDQKMQGEIEWDKTAASRR